MKVLSDRAREKVSDADFQRQVREALAEKDKASSNGSTRSDEIRLPASSDEASKKK